MKQKRSKPPSRVIIIQEAVCNGDDRRYAEISINGILFTSDRPRCAADVFSINDALREMYDVFSR